MTNQEFTAALNAIGWGTQALSRRLSVRDRTINRWRAGSEPIPDKIAAWLLVMVDYMAKAPAPPP